MNSSRRVGAVRMNPLHHAGAVLLLLILAAAAGNGLPPAWGGPATARAELKIPPPPPRYVYDGAQWLTATQKRQLEQTLLDFERQSSNQLVVGIFPSLEGEDIAAAGHRIAESWGMGRKSRDNGILLAVFVKEKKVRIEVGYGLEGAITDLLSHTIIEEEIVPRLRQGDRFGGLQAGVEAIMAASRGEYKGSGRALGDKKKKRDMPLGVWIFLMIIFINILGRRGRRGRGLPFMFYGGGFGGGGGGGGGGFGGGGFSGGGGGFGGGGASGGW